MSRSLYSGQLRIAEDKTAHFDKLILSLALNYGGRQEITRAARLFLADVMNGESVTDQLTEDFFSRYLYTAGSPDPDLVIRTGGEIRISNFLLWQIAYAELYFTEVLWPDFGKPDLIEALKEFQSRERRFGCTGEQVRQRQKLLSDRHSTTADRQRQKLSSDNNSTMTDIAHAHAEDKLFPMALIANPKR